MTCHVFTARMGTRDPDWLDITAGGNARRPELGGHRGIGEAFAPPSTLLLKYLRKRSAGAITDSDWADYSARYTAFMRQSYRERRPAWDAILALPRVVLVCFCTDPNRCHRRILAGILAKLGAVDCGEIERPLPGCPHHRDDLTELGGGLLSVRCKCGAQWREAPLNPGAEQ